MSAAIKELRSGLACGLAAMLCAVAVSACGAGHRSGATTSTYGATSSVPRGARTVYIYSSLPLNGPQRAASLQIQRGIALALHSRPYHDHVGGYQVRYRALSDSTRRLGHWSAAQTVRNAELVARNPQAVAYIGDLDSGATELSLPILNQAQIVQLTPGSGYPGLTDAVKGISLPGEPGKFYPQRNRTLLRLIPSDMVQAAAALDLLSRMGCTHLGLWQLGTRGQEAEALTNAIRRTAIYYGITIIKTPALPRAVKDYINYVHALQTTVNCALLTGRPTARAGALTVELHAQLNPGTRIVGTASFCSSAWAGSFKHYLPTQAQTSQVYPSLYCTTPLRKLRSYRGSGAFIATYRARFHQQPDTYAYYGYQAAELVLAAMSGLSPSVDNRLEVMDGLINGAASGPLGAFFSNGNLASDTYGVERIVNGKPQPYGSGALTPVTVL